jgi:diguanylate cyclase (GGDEF)-like protein
LVKPCNPLELKVRLRAGRRVIELQEQLVKARESLRFEAMHDSLTGLLNRGAVLEQLSNELVRASRRGAPVAVLMADLDHFKTINDTHGHVAGDAVLRETSRRLKAGVRAYDSVGRLGGEEFICVLPECDAKTSLAVAQRLVRSLADTPTTYNGKPIAHSISIGVAATDQFGPARADELIRAADAALYRAKHAGRSRALLAIDREFESVKEVSQTLPALVPAE